MAAADDPDRSRSVERWLLLRVVALAVLCQLVLQVAARALQNEGQARLIWVCCTALAGFGLGWRDRLAGWPEALALLWMQLALVLVVDLLSGELFWPSRSTGGLVGLFIGTLFMVLLTPVPLIGFWLGLLVARLSGTGRGAPDDRPPTHGADRAERAL